MVDIVKNQDIVMMAVELKGINDYLLIVHLHI